MPPLSTILSVNPLARLKVKANNLLYLLPKLIIFQHLANTIQSLNRDLDRAKVSGNQHFVMVIHCSCWSQMSVKVPLLSAKTIYIKGFT